MAPEVEDKVAEGRGFEHKILPHERDLEVKNEQDIEHSGKGCLAGGSCPYKKCRPCPLCRGFQEDRSM
ncbi:hypothetical protein QQ045_003267 [Rhodiola kirilowii]